ncbi:MAG: SH3 domain-containing protein [Sarcina sp.]
MNRKRLTAVILSAGLMIGGASLHNTTTHNNVLLTDHLANIESSATTANQGTTNIENANKNVTPVNTENKTVTASQNSAKKNITNKDTNTSNINESSKPEISNNKISEHKTTEKAVSKEVKTSNKIANPVKTSTKEAHSNNVNQNLALEANTNIQIAYIGGANDTQMNGNSQNTYSFAAINPNSATNETNANAAPETTSNAPLTFASPLQKQLYEYLSVPANQATTMNEAINLHDGNPNDTCVLFQSSALRANGFNIPMSTAYTTVFQGNLLESGWQRHTDFNNLQPGDICFASSYHTFMFMGWYNKEKKIAYVMGNESYMNSKYYRERHIDGQVAAPSNGNSNQYKATCYYTYNGTPSKKPILSGEIIGGTTNVMSEPFDGGSVVGQVYYGDNVAVLQQKGYYYEIEHNGMTGWVYAVDLMPNGILKNYVAPNNNNNNTNTNNNNNNSNQPTVNTTNKGETIQVTSPVGLWLLNSPSMQGGKITVMPYNTQLNVLGTNGSWTKVNYNGQTGWCYTQYTKVIGQAQPAKPEVKPVKPEVQPTKPVVKPESNGIIGTTTITSGVGLWQLSAPSMQGGHITVIPYGTKVNVYGEQNGWYEVSYNGVKGWSYASYTSGVATASSNTPAPAPTQTSTATVNSGVGLWLLNAPSMQGGHITVMPDNSQLTVLGHSGNWTKVNYNGTIGWCYSQYTTQSSNQAPSQPTTPSHPVVNNSSSIGSTTITSGIGLWQLTSPSMQGGHITVIPSGAQVQVFAEQNGWYEVSYNGVKGWSYAKYTSGLNSNTNAASTSQGAIKQVTSPIGLWLLQSPALTAGKIEILTYQAKLQVLAQNGAWTKVSYNGTEGWCYTQYTKNI